MVVYDIGNKQLDNYMDVTGIHYARYMIKLHRISLKMKNRKKPDKNHRLEKFI